MAKPWWRGGAMTWSSTADDVGTKHLGCEMAYKRCGVSSFGVNDYDEKEHYWDNLIKMLFFFLHTLF